MVFFKGAFAQHREQNLPRSGIFSSAPATVLLDHSPEQGIRLRNAGGCHFDDKKYLGQKYVFKKKLC